MMHPLFCWDIVIEGISRRKEFAKDIASLKLLKERNNWHLSVERTLDNCIVGENKTIIATNPDLQIILATENMYDMNGYLPDEVIGKKS